MPSCRETPQRRKVGQEVSETSQSFEGTGTDEDEAAELAEMHRERVRMCVVVAEQHAEALRNPQPVTENYWAQIRKKDK